MAAESSIGQRGRLVILVLYLAGLSAASRVALGSWLPPTSERGLWFYAALAALLLGNLLVTPFFTKPADAVSYAVAAIIALLSVNPWGSPGRSDFDRYAWSLTFLYALVSLFAALFAITLKNAARSTPRRVAQTAQILAAAAASPRAIFSVVFLFALITYHRTSLREYVVISLAWAVFVGLRPLEGAARLWRRCYSLWVTRGDRPRFGEVVGHEWPGLVLIREDPDATATLGQVLVARTGSGDTGLVLALDHVGFADGRWLRAIQLTDSVAPDVELNDGELTRLVAEGGVFRTEPGDAETVAAQRSADMQRRVLGLVAPDTNVGQLQIELVRSDLALQEGTLVEVEIRARTVLYQIVKGLTREEILKEKNTHGFVRAQAKKVGSWNPDSGSFDPVPWLPQPNQPVFLVEARQHSTARGAVGHFPGTTYPVCFDPHLGVTHNTAILGILGVGKTFLALELIERMINQGIKVICLDMTNQYADELAPFLDSTRDSTESSELQGVGPAGSSRVSQNVEEGGSIREFGAKLKEQLAAFLGAGDPRKLRTLNPVQFEVWRQDSKPYQGRASMATLTPTEVTRIITEAVLDVLQSQGLTDRARCCIVYEEAHSLIPEWNAVASEGDKAATNGTAKAILQGRKFGLGCMVVTQRTANVTKSILNQCNTVFALRVFDATGIEFLKNYIGEDYSGVLSTLEDRHAVLFGRASSCRDPVLTRLNDRCDFIEVFRAPPASVAPEEPSAGIEVANPTPGAGPSPTPTEAPGPSE